MSSTRFTRRRSLAHSFRTRDMSLGRKIRAAESGIFFWKKLRSSTFMARFTGGRKRRDISSSAGEA